MADSPAASQAATAGWIIWLVVRWCSRAWSPSACSSNCLLLLRRRLTLLLLLLRLLRLLARLLRLQLRWRSPRPAEVSACRLRVRLGDRARGDGDDCRGTTAAISTNPSPRYCSHGIARPGLRFAPRCSGPGLPPLHRAPES
jgi:hypothetical protein